MSQFQPCHATCHVHALRAGVFSVVKHTPARSAWAWHKAVLLMLLIVPSLAAAPAAAPYRWVREISTIPVKQTVVAAAPLDWHVFHFTREGRPDLRVVNQRGEPVGYVIRVATGRQPQTKRTFWIAEQTAAKVDPETGLSIELKLRDNELPPTGLRIVTPLSNFEHQVRVETSADGTTWTDAGPPTVIFDYSRHIDARSDVVPFAAGEHRRFRVTIADLTTEQESELLELHRRLRGEEEIDRSERTFIDRRPFRVDRIEFYRDEQETGRGITKMTQYPAANFQAGEDAEKRQTVLEIGTQHEPLSQITLLTQNTNFSRAATVEAEAEDSEGRTMWKKIAAGTLTRYAIGSIRQNSLKLEVPETYASRYRVIIENRDSAPLAIAGVELTGPQLEIVFLAEPGEQVWLEYGSAEARAGQYDTAALNAALAANTEVIPATLEPPHASTGTPRKSAWKPWEDRRILGGAGLGLALLLGWGLFHASRRVPPPVESP